MLTSWSTLLTPRYLHKEILQRLNKNDNKETINRLRPYMNSWRPKSVYHIILLETVQKVSPSMEFFQNPYLQLHFLTHRLDPKNMEALCLEESYKNLETQSIPHPPKILSPVNQPHQSCIMAISGIHGDRWLDNCNNVGARDTKIDSRTDKLSEFSAFFWHQTIF